VESGVEIDPRNARAGDKIIVNGPIAVHGIAIMSVREGLAFDTEIRSDTAALNTLVDVILKAGRDVHVLRDPTRGGVASVVNEIAQSSRKGIFLNEAALPIGEEVRGACEILGLDPLYVANEGKLLAFVAPGAAEKVLHDMRAHPLGKDSVIIGEVVNEHPGIAVMKSSIGGTRVVDMISGEQLPRIC
jgi:hydrogenase expression/formation protein HypE